MHKVVIRRCIDNIMIHGKVRYDSLKHLSFTFFPLRQGGTCSWQLIRTIPGPWCERQNGWLCSVQKKISSSERGSPNWSADILITHRAAYNFWVALLNHGQGLVLQDDHDRNTEFLLSKIASETALSIILPIASGITDHVRRRNSSWTFQKRMRNRPLTSMSTWYRTKKILCIHIIGRVQPVISNTQMINKHGEG